MHIDVFLRHIQAYLAPCISLTYHSRARFQTLVSLELDAYLKPCETLTRHIQNPAIVRTVYPSIICHIRVYLEPCVMLACEDF